MKIEKSLEKLYLKNRIVVWYDPEQAFSDEIDKLSIPEVSVITIANDELAVKFRILHQKPTQKFLLYMPYARPSYEDNWLLDVEMSQKIFHTDQESMLLQELELPLHLQSWLKQQSTFFKNKERMEKFRNLAQKEDTVPVLNQKLIQVILGSSQYDLDQLLRDYVQAFKDEKADTVKESLLKFSLADFFWDEIKTYYGINNESHNIYDFLLILFQFSFAPLCGENRVMSSAKVKLSNWKDLKSFSNTFDVISAKVSKDLNVEGALQNVVLEDVLEDDLFEVIEKRIVRDVIKKVTDHTFNVSRVEDIIKKRESKHWFVKYSGYYNAALKAAQLLDEIEHTNLKELSDLEKGFSLYSKYYFKIDQYYRQFISLVRNSESTILKPLYDDVEKLYSNRWLLDLSHQWQQCIEKDKEWYFGAKSQRTFYDSIIKSKYVDQKKKVFVIISDALRYEIGEELHRNINQQNRFHSILDYRVTGLPSYTQLGMAALLPNNKITFGESDDVFVDGLASKGSIARTKILNEIGGIKATTILADELASYKVKSEEAKDLVQLHDVVYVYHNIIDKTGDDKVSEEKVFEAAQTELENLVNLIKRISSFNITHIVITADHGFIYQNEALSESDFADAKINGNVSKSNRRFVIGKGLTHNDSVVKYKATDLKIDSETDILIPKGMNRLRRQGAGSRFIHGGAMLQEVMVPVLLITKKREDTISKVDVDIINKSNNKITTNIHPVKFYQSEGVAERLLGRKIKSYLAIQDGGQKTIISDVFIHYFDSNAVRAEDRELMHQFKISTTINRHSEVYLFLEEQIEDSTQWVDYLKYKFSLTLGMMNDFDDF